jgi:hypothetical protein
LQGAARLGKREVEETANQSGSFCRLTRVATSPDCDLAMAKIQRALLSVSDKTGLVAFARTLSAAGVINLHRWARRALRADLTVKDSSEYTGFEKCSMAA